MYIIFLAPLTFIVPTERLCATSCLRLPSIPSTPPSITTSTTSSSSVHSRFNFTSLASLNFVHFLPVWSRVQVLLHLYQTCQLLSTQFTVCSFLLYLNSCLVKLGLFMSKKFFLIFTLMRTNSTICLLYTSPSPRDMRRSRMPSSA